MPLIIRQIFIILVKSVDAELKIVRAQCFAGINLQSFSHNSHLVYSELINPAVSQRAILETFLPHHVIMCCPYCRPNLMYFDAPPDRLSSACASSNNCEENAVQQGSQVEMREPSNMCKIVLWFRKIPLKVHHRLLLLL